MLDKILRLFKKKNRQKLTITVIEDHINNGVRWSRFHCPIALAAEEVTGHSAMVYSDYLTVGNNTHYKLPIDAQYFMIMFDVGASVNPATFVMEEA